MQLMIGNPVESFGLTSEDIEADFDPESYDKAMQNAFSEEYYEGNDDDEEKPEFSDIEMEDEGRAVSIVIGERSEPHTCHVNGHSDIYIIYIYYICNVYFFP